MSCYKLTPHDENECTVRVGYDGTARSCYVYVARPMLVEQGKVVGDNNGHVILYEGLTGTPIKTIEELERLVSPFATLNEGVKEKLRDDMLRAETPAGPGGREKVIEVVR